MSKPIKLTFPDGKEVVYKTIEKFLHISGLTPATITWALKRGYLGYGKYKGAKIETIDDYDSGYTFIDPEYSELLKSNDDEYTIKITYPNDTIQMFKTIKGAAKKFDCTPQNIMGALKCGHIFNKNIKIERV